MFVRIFRTISLSALLLAMIGCSKTFVVTGNIPQPLIAGTPVVAQMQYSEEFKTYAYLEKGDDRALKSVGFGAAQVTLFDKIFGSLFTLAKDGQPGAAIKIEPEILDFQYSVPRETKLNLYEVWLKYRLRITDDQNRKVADWVVKGYGKTPTSMMKSYLKAFNIACNIALRDVGAQLAIGFRKQPSIKEFLAKRADLETEISAESSPVIEAGQRSNPIIDQTDNSKQEGTQ